MEKVGYCWWHLTVYGEFDEVPPDGRVDFVHLGCPHASFEEMREYGRLLAGRTVADGVELWITTSRAVRALAEQSGILTVLRSAGARVITDTCPMSCHFARTTSPDADIDLPAPPMRVMVVDSAIASLSSITSRCWPTHLGVGVPDHFQMLWRPGDPEKVLDRSRPQWESWGIDEQEARGLVRKYFMPKIGGRRPSLPMRQPLHRADPGRVPDRLTPTARSRVGCRLPM